MEKSAERGSIPAWRRRGAHVLLACCCALLTASASDRIEDGRWFADQGDGTYRNPVLIGDYSDPDVVRVGDDYYLTASSFANVPGLPILHSRDLVNWTIIGHALPKLTPEAHFRTPRRGGGVWAPAIRHHGGRFMIYYPDPDFGIFRVTATDPRGPWSAPELVDATRGAIDPAPFWDEDGTGWLVHAFARSRAGKANLIVLKRLDPDGGRTVGEVRTIIDGDALPPVATSVGLRPWQTTEGPKLYKRDGWYYVLVPSGSVKGGWQGVFRSRRIEGPYEGRNVLDQGTTDVNGPHQGAWVTTPTGEDWFLHFQDRDSYGRVVHLQPMAWRNGWPVIGADPDGDGRGEPVARHRKPMGPAQPRTAPVADDEFAGPLSLAWQWNSNPDADWLTLADGQLRLKSVSGSANLYEAGNLLSQKLPGEAFTATTLMHFQPLRSGERAGLAMLGQRYAWIGIERQGDALRLVQGRRDGIEPSPPEQRTSGPLAPDGRVWLRLEAAPVTTRVGPPDFTPYWPSMLRETHMRVRFSYSLDGIRFVPLGKAFESRPGRWVGAQIGLFAQAQNGTPASIATTVGHADFDWFRITR
ncbi:glycoside hydrolase 43 family protein [Sphingomonas cannabina]|uniref:glycoside hydrolase family 43 protein n=1 Tax=Sphingomonas cannabina TaxID=2899123 RepID=UPI001F45E24E|nr:glycoside hydrolase 43 family protein [Sphingomonas cannabina]UIJ47194.1 glycoside hydrolase 43 family protein [Sphingomonas cannabina]